MQKVLFRQRSGMVIKLRLVLVPQILVRDVLALAVGEIKARLFNEISSEEEGFDQQSEHCGSYSLSANVSESESSSFSYRWYDADGAFCYMPLFPLAHRSFTGTPSFPAKLPPPDWREDGRRLMTKKIEEEDEKKGIFKNADKVKGDNDDLSTRYVEGGLSGINADAFVEDISQLRVHRYSDIINMISNLPSIEIVVVQILLDFSKASKIS
ncbi:hypothetical protein LguiA_020818 [Lonicera macranthoides]